MERRCCPFLNFQLSLSGNEDDWLLTLTGPKGDYYRNMEVTRLTKRDDAGLTARYADMLSAMGTEPRLRIVRLLLSAHPDGMVVGEIGSELDIPSSTLSHHLEKLKNEDLVSVRRGGHDLWYSVNTGALQDSRSFMPNAVRGTRRFSLKRSFAANEEST